MIGYSFIAITVTLSSPPADLAFFINSSVTFNGFLYFEAILKIAWSLSIEFKPSEQRIMRSPGRMPRLMISGVISLSVPTTSFK